MRINVIQKYDKVPIQAKATLWFFVCSLFQNGISFLTIPIFTRIMSQEQFGEYALYLSWLGFVEVFATLMLWGGGFNKAMLDFADDRKGYISAIQGLTTFITIGLLTIYLFVGETFVTRAGISLPIMICMFVQLIFLPAFQFWAQHQKYEYKYKSYIIYSLLLSVLSPVVAFIAVSNSDNKGEARILAIVAVETFFNLFFYIYNFAAGKKIYSKRYWKYALSFNLVLVPHYVANSILSQADRIMIGYFCDENQVGIYSLIYNFAMILQIVTNSVAASLTPWIYRKIKDNEPEKVKKVTLYLQSGFAVLALLFCLFAPEIVLFMGGEQYMEGVNIIAPVICSSFCIFVAVILNAVEYYFAAKYEILIATVLSALCNVILNFMFIPQYGYIAAAYTTLASYFIFEVLHIIFLKGIYRKNNVKTAYFNCKIIVIQTMVLILLTSAITMLYSQNIVRYALFIFVCGAMFFYRRRIKAIFELLK